MQLQLMFYLLIQQNKVKQNQYFKDIDSLSEQTIHKQEKQKMSLSIQTISSFPPIGNEHKSQSIHSSNPKISVLSAINKLKQTQSRIVEASNKEAAKRRINQAMKNRQFTKKNLSAYKESIRKSFQMDKTMRQKSLQQRMRQQTKLHQLATTLRQTRYQFRQQIKSAFRQSSSQIYEQTISQRQRNQQLIKEFKQREMLIKQQNRMKIAEKLGKSREKVKKFKQSRVSFIKQEREKDVEELERKIMARSRYLERLGDNRSINDNSLSVNSKNNNDECVYNKDSRSKGSQLISINPESGNKISKNNSQQQQQLSLTIDAK